MRLKQTYHMQFSTQAAKWTSLSLQQSMARKLTVIMANDL